MYSTKGWTLTTSPSEFLPTLRTKKWKLMLEFELAIVFFFFIQYTRKLYIRHCYREKSHLIKKYISKIFTNNISSYNLIIFISDVLGEIKWCSNRYSLFSVQMILTSHLSKCELHEGRLLVPYPSHTASLLPRSTKQTCHEHAMDEPINQ